jgi:hypothetical protein
MDRSGPAAGTTAARAGIGFAEERLSDTTIIPSAAIGAASGEPPSTTQRSWAIALVAGRPVVRGALRGFATIELPFGLPLVDCPEYISNGRVWVSPLAKPVLDRDGRPKNDANGKPGYAPVAEWGSRKRRDRFSEVVIAAIRQMYSGALDSSGS